MSKEEISARLNDLASKLGIKIFESIVNEENIVAIKAEMKRLNNEFNRLLVEEAKKAEVAATEAKVAAMETKASE